MQDSRCLFAVRAEHTEHQQNMRTKTNHRSGFTALEVMCTVAVIILFAAIAIPNLKRVHEKEQIGAIVHNLRIIEDAKYKWALEHKKLDGAAPVATDLIPFMKTGAFPPTFVVGETYDINTIGTHATAEIPVKLGNYPAGGIVTLP